MFLSYTGNLWLTPLFLKGLWSNEIKSRVYFLLFLGALWRIAGQIPIRLVCVFAARSQAAVCPSLSWWMSWCLSKSQVIAPQQTHLKYLNRVKHEWLGDRVSKSATVKGHCGWKRSVTVILGLCWRSRICLRHTGHVHKHVPTVQPTATKQIQWLEICWASAN